MNLTKALLVGSVIYAVAGMVAFFAREWALAAACWAFAAYLEPKL